MAYNPLATSDVKAEQLADMARAANNAAYQAELSGDEEKAKDIAKEAADYSEQASKFSRRAAYNK